MSSIKVAWNRKQKASVVLGKLKEFTISENLTNEKYSARGWYNKENSFLFGDDFETEPEARKFLNDIFAKM